MKTIQDEMVQEQAKEILENAGESELVFLRRAVPDFVDFLCTKEPDYWKNYGMYWFNLKDVIQHHDPKAYRKLVEHVAGEENLPTDEKMKKEFDYGSDINNWVAAHEYMNQRAEGYENGAGNAHHYYGENDIVRLYDPSKGFIDETEATDEQPELEE